LGRGKTVGVLEMFYLLESPRHKLSWSEKLYWWNELHWFRFTS